MRATNEAGRHPEESVADELKRICAPKMTDHVQDLDHDAAWIAANPGKPFMHLTRERGTQLIEMPDAAAMIKDEERPHVFGAARPSEIYRQNERLIRQFQSSAVGWCEFDGLLLRQRTAGECLRRYGAAREKAAREARRRRR
jgi:hypothetical protein